MTKPVTGGFVWVWASAGLASENARVENNIAHAIERQDSFKFAMFRLRLAI
jgi:hypothetical protein